MSKLERLLWAASLLLCLATSPAAPAHYNPWPPRCSAVCGAASPSPGCSTVMSAPALIPDGWINGLTKALRRGRLQEQDAESVRFVRDGMVAFNATYVPPPVPRTTGQTGQTITP